MSYITEEMKKGLVALIDETMDELEELKKSNRFSASEIKIEGPGKGIGGKPSNGKLDAKKADDEDEDEDDKKEDEDKDDDDMDKADGQNRQADPNGGKHQPVAKADDDMDKMDDDMDKADGQNRQADPNGGKHQPVAKADDDEDCDDDDEDCDDDDDKKKKKKGENPFKKSIDDSQDLMKSYIDTRLSSFEDKFEKMFDIVKDIADAPVPSKGSSYKSLTPLQKSADEGTEPLNKSTLVNKLFELKKSGTSVDTLDIMSVELGNPAELAKIAEKYSIN